MIEVIEESKPIIEEVTAEVTTDAFKDDIKSILYSKTFWVGFLSVVAGIIEATLGQLNAGAQITMLGLAMIILRIFTTQAVNWKLN